MKSTRGLNFYRLTALMAVFLLFSAGCAGQIIKSGPETTKKGLVKEETSLRKPERFITDNGITVLFLERSSLPFITVNVTIRAGSVFEPPELAGLAGFTADLLTEGTAARSSGRISEEIDFIGGSLSSSGGIDFSSASLKVLSKDREKGFELLSDILLNPSFPEEEIERERSQVKASIISKADDPSTVAAEEFNELLFGDHPYSRPAEGYLDSIEKISRDHIVDFHKRYFLPNNSIIAVVGDMKKRELVRLLDKYFGPWKRGNAVAANYAHVKPLVKKVVKVIDKDLTQANVQLGHIGMKRDNPDFYAAYVMNYILGGGGFVSRLMTEIRDNQGLVYSVYSYFNPLKDPGPFKVGLQTKNESAKEAIEESLRQIKAMIEKGVTGEELRNAKDYLVGSFPLKFTTNSKIAGYLTYMEVYKLGLDYLDKFPKIIESLTIEDINRAAGKYLDPENYLLVVVGNEKKMGELDI
ncbi:MAG: insulinase family protein [Deltaproteobacteria bacterium]|nr:insulinase family protein [Deltaproteobacteria bacterium]